MEEISGNYNSIGLSRYDRIYGRAESLGDISFTLVDAAGGLPVVLPDAEVRVCKVGQFHGWRMDLDTLNSKQLRRCYSPAQARTSQAGGRSRPARLSRLCCLRLTEALGLRVNHTPRFPTESYAAARGIKDLRY